ncbi:hypothetical protein FB45DRAFT_1066375 [Roridomyces roridus]|uniref:F-box domain-containing protein n=1 Tax=Roridomyces roridus TaxID=1738132 RepID=A0AAD7FBL7_9AGAR|nr:hypothetical protein FB45DRAFT_1066375 [Roridomyces roridus]
MTLNLLDFPFDILLELTKQLDLADSLHLAATCSACAALLQSHSFWIESLHRMENIHRRPIRCEPGTDLTTPPLGVLRQMAVHAYKLRKNWTSDSPLPVTTHSYYIPGESYVSHIFPIEGTHMVLTVFRGGLGCVNTTIGEYLAKCDREPTDLDHCSRPLYSAGMCSVAFASYHSDRQELTLAVFSVDYRDLEAVTVSSTFSRSWLRPDRLRIECVIASENTLGVVGSTNGEDPCLFYCRTAEPQELLRTALGIQSDSPAAFESVSIGHDFVVFAQARGPSAEIVHAAPTHMDSTRHDLTPVPMNPSGRLSRIALNLRHLHTRAPTYGILNVMLRATEDGSAHRVLFWPAEYSAAHASMGSSGTSVVIRDTNYTDGVFLLQYIHEPTPHVESRRLPIPPRCTSYSQEIMFALDDRSGVVYQARRDSDPEPLDFFGSDGLRFKAFQFV